MHLVPGMRSAEKEIWYFVFIGITDTQQEQNYELKPLQLCWGFTDLGKVKLVQFTDYSCISWSIDWEAYVMS